MVRTLANRKSNLRQQNAPQEQQQESNSEQLLQVSSHHSSDYIPEYAIDVIKNSNMPPDNISLKSSKKRHKKAADKANNKKAKEHRTKPQKSGPKTTLLEKPLGNMLNYDDPIYLLNGIRPCLSNSTKKSAEGVVISSQSTAKKYLTDKNWAVLVDQGSAFPTKNLQWDEVTIQIERTDSKKQYLVKPANIFHYLDEEDKVIFASFALQRIPYLIKPPYDISRYNTAAGAAPLSGRASEIDQNATAGTGFYTYQKANKIMAYNSGDLFGRPWFFWGSQEQDYKDCLVHAVNYALRCPYFQAREQIIRLMSRRMKYSADKASEYKANAGVPLTVFKDFAIYQDKALSLQPIFTLKNNDANAKEQFKNLILTQEWNELIITAVEINFGNHTSHAFSLIKVPRINQQYEILKLDSKMPEREYLVSIDQSKKLWNIDYFLANVYSATINQFSFRQLSTYEKSQITAELKAIMTGDYTELESMQILNQKLNATLHNQQKQMNKQ